MGVLQQPQNSEHMSQQRLSTMQRLSGFRGNVTDVIRRASLFQRRTIGVVQWAFGFRKDAAGIVQRRECACVDGLVTKSFLHLKETTSESKIAPNKISGTDYYTAKSLCIKFRELIANGDSSAFPSTFVEPLSEPMTESQPKEHLLRKQFNNFLHSLQEMCIQFQALIIIYEIKQW